MSAPAGTRGHPVPDAPMVPGGADLTELCTSPSPYGTCLQRIVNGRRPYSCQECLDQLGQMLAAAGVGLSGSRRHPVTDYCQGIGCGCAERAR